MRIYIADSCYEVLKQLDTLINGYHQYKAECFTTPKQIADAVRNEPPDLVIIDTDMVNGMAAVKNIMYEYPKTKVVIMSESQSKLAEYFKLDLSGFLKKPISEEQLKEQLFRAMHPCLAKMKYGKERKSDI